MWIVRIALSRPYTFVVLALLILLVGPAHDRAHADRHLPEHRHPGRHRRLELRRPVGRGDGQPDRLDLRAHADHDGQRHRARRVAVAARHRRGQGLLPAGRQDRPRGRAGHRRRRSRSCASCRPARSRRSSSPTTRRACRSCSSRCPATELSEQQLFDLGVNFLRTAARRRCRARRCRIPYGGKQPQIQVDLDPDALQAKAPVADRRRQRDQRAEPDPARRHVEDRRARVRRRHQRAARRRRRAERPADQDGRRHARSTSATSRTCATATRRRPTSSASTASAPR